MGWLHIQYPARIHAVHRRNSEIEISLRIRQGKTGEFGKELGSVTKSTYKAQANQDWKTFTYTHNVKHGSALDFSAKLDAPAGKYGPVIRNANGNFVFRDRPEKTVRFYGPNLVGTSQIPIKNSRRKWRTVLQASASTSSGFIITTTCFSTTRGKLRTDSTPRTWTSSTTWRAV